MTGEAQTTYNDQGMHLGFHGLVEMWRRIPRPTYSFRIEGLDMDLDIRDYLLDVYDDLYMLVRKANPLGPPDEILLPQHAISLHPATLIWLKDLTPEMANDLIETYPTLKTEGIVSTRVKE